MFRKLFASPLLRVGLAVVLILAVVLPLKPVTIRLLRIRLTASTRMGPPAASTPIVSSWRNFPPRACLLRQI